EYKDVDK
nr:56 kda actin-sequestering protein, ASP-56=peptide T4 [swine, platelets, Peptide Partial, 7 aa] [Sus scrofa]